MNSQQATKIDELKSSLVAGMESYLQDVGAECGYTQTDVEACAKIVDSYVVAVSRAASPETIMDEVRKTVTRLNELNDQAGGGLIETSQREDLCLIINKGAEYAGYEVDSDDLTEEWREW